MGEQVHTGGDWHVLPLRGDDTSWSSSAVETPATASRLRTLDGAVVRILTAQYSILSAGTHIRPHCGTNNERLTAHLVLKPGSNATIRVHRRTRRLRAYDVLIFDDS